MSGNKYGYVGDEYLDDDIEFNIEDDDEDDEDEMSDDDLENYVDSEAL